MTVVGSVMVRMAVSMERFVAASKRAAEGMFRLAATLDWLYVSRPRIESGVDRWENEGGRIA